MPGRDVTQSCSLLEARLRDTLVCNEMKYHAATADSQGGEHCRSCRNYRQRQRLSHKIKIKKMFLVIANIRDIQQDPFYMSGKAAVEMKHLIVL